MATSPILPFSCSTTTTTTTHSPSLLPSSNTHTSSTDPRIDSNPSAPLIPFTCAPSAGNSSDPSRPFYILIADDTLPILMTVMCCLSQLYCYSQDLQVGLPLRNVTYPISEEVLRLANSIQELAPGRISEFVFLLVEKASEAEKALMQQECTIFTKKSCSETGSFKPNQPISIAIVDGNLQNPYDGFDVMQRCQPQLIKEGSFQTIILPHSVDLGPQKNPIPSLEEKEQKIRDSLRISFIEPSRILPKFSNENAALLNLFYRILSEAIVQQLAKFPKNSNIIKLARSTPSTPRHRHRHRSKTPPYYPTNILGTDLSPTFWEGTTSDSSPSSIKPRESLSLPTAPLGILLPPGLEEKEED